MYDDKHGDIQKTNKYAPREKKLFDFKRNKAGEAKVGSPIRISQRSNEGCAGIIGGVQDRHAHEPHANDDRGDARRIPQRWVGNLQQRRERYVG